MTGNSETKGATPPNLERVHIHVSGRVQGVGFRAHVMEAGTRLRLTGWVRNVGYDEVETIAEGPRSALERFAEETRRGPLGSRVDDMRLEWETATGEFQRFNMRSSH